MKLEEIKNMSDEEFVEFVNKYSSIYKKPEPEKTLKSLRKMLNIVSIFGGLVMGTLPYMIVDRFTDDAGILSLVYVGGALACIPISKELIKHMYIKLENMIATDKLNDLSKLKKNLENLSDEQLAYLKNISDNSDIHILHEKIIDIFGEESPNNFINDLDPTYVDEEKELGYSKTMNKND